MKRFIIKSILYIMPTLVALVFIELGVRQVPNTYTLKRNYLESKSDSIEVLILGNSHVFFGIDPHFFDLKTFNAANVSQSWLYDWSVLKFYGDNLKRLKTIILPVSYGSLFTNSDAFLRSRFYVMYLKTNTSFSPNDHVEILNGELQTSTKKLWNYQFHGEVSTGSSTLGWGDFYRSSAALDLETEGRKRAKQHTAKNLSIPNPQSKALNAIIKYCETRKIRLVLISIPVHKAYMKNLRSEQLEHTINYAKEVAKGNSFVSYHNLFQDSDFTSSDFFDGDHLNEIGAEKLSIKLNELVSKDLTSNKNP